MNAMSDHLIVNLKPDPGSFTVYLEWKGGATTRADFSKIVGDGVFQPLKDPAFFGKVSTRANGRVLTWPGEIDFGADALWFEAFPGDLPVTMRQEYTPPLTRLSFPNP